MKNSPSNGKGIVPGKENRNATLDAETIFNVFMEAPVGIIVFSGPFHIIEMANGQALEIWQKPGSEIVNRPALEAIPEMAELGVGKILDHLYRDGEPFTASEIPLNMSVGGASKTLYFDINFRTVKNTNGETEKIISTATDVTDKVLARRQIEESRKKLQVVTDALPVLISYVDNLRRYRFNNKAYENWFGHSTADIYGKTLEEVLGTAAYSHLQPKVDRVLAGETVHFETLIPYKDAGEKYVIAEYIPHFDESRHVAGFIVLVSDITERRQIEEKLETVQKQLELTIENVPATVYLFDTTGRILFLSKPGRDHIQQLLGDGYNSQDTIESLLKKVADKIEFRDEHGELLTPQQYPMNIVLSTGKPAELMIKRVYKESDKVEWFLNKVTPLLDDEGKVQFILSTATDYTQQKKTEEDLRLSEAYFRQLTETIPGIIWITDPKGYCLYLNQNWYNYTGQTKDEAEGFGWLTATHPDDKASAEKTFLEANEAKRPFSLVYRLRNKDGQYRWAVDNGSPKFSATGEFEGYIGTVLDIHEQKEAEEKIRESEGRFAAAVNAVQGILWTNNSKGEMEGEQPGWASLTGQSYEEYQGFGWAKAVHPDDAQPSIEAWNTAVANRTTFEFEHRVRKKNGEWGLYYIKAIPVLNVDGSIREWVGVHTDVTEQRKAENIIRESEHRFRLMADASPVMIWTLDAEGKSTYYNKRALEFTGHTEEELKGGKSWQTAIHPDDISHAAEVVGNAVATCQPYQMECRMKRADGQWRWLLSHGMPRLGKNNELLGYVGSSVDITERKNAEQQLLQSEKRFHTLADALPQMVWMRDTEGNIEFGSRHWAEYSGIEGISAAWKQMVHPDDWGPVMTTWERHTRSAEPFRFEVRLKNKDGEYRWHYGVGEPIKDTNGNLLKWIGALTDIHSQKSFSESLERLVNERTQALERSNEDLQQFAHVASHDLKEPLRKIKTFSGRLETEIADMLNERSSSYLAKIESAANRMSAMIDGVLNYSSYSASPETAEIVDLNDVLKNIEVDLEVMIHDKNALIRYKNLPVLVGSPVLLYQLFYNLINNSIKFAKAGLPPEIEISSEIISENALAIAQITLRDNGIGFDETQSESIFDIFTRLNSKDRYEGTGLGLALCRKIVQRHGGTIKAHGVINGGAVFTIKLPLKQEKESI